MLLHVDTFRLKAHSKGDDERDPEVVYAYTREDPLNRILAEKNPDIDQMLHEIDQRLVKAIRKAEDAPFTSIPQKQNRANESQTSKQASSSQWQQVNFESVRIDEGIRTALCAAMENDERVILLGEDIEDPYGGAFKVTRGLSNRFPRQVHNTPISEAAIVGMGNGLALAGQKPVVEIMFGDFMLLAADQWANHAAKFAGMYDHQVRVPLIVRTPMGGYRGYGPTHSQCLEKHFLGLPGTRVIALHKRCDPGSLYQNLLSANDRPTLVVENKMLYAKKAHSVPPAGFKISKTDEPFPITRVQSPGKSILTIVAYGGMAELAETAAVNLWEEEELACELLIPSQLYPLQLAPFLESIEQTGRLLVVEEGQGFAAWGSELIAQLNEHKKRPALNTGRVYAAGQTIPTSRPAEAESLPSIHDVKQSAIDLILA
jgi:2-oxoisovalerate dehydrogenase E1 component